MRLRVLTLIICLVFGPPSSASQTDPASLLHSGRYQEALIAVQSELKSHPNDARLLTVQGIALAQMGDEQAALKSYRSALAVSPYYLPALEGAAQIEYKTNDAAAVVHLDRLVEINGKDETARAMRGVLAARAGRCEPAVLDFTAAPTALAKSPEALRQEGACLLRLRRWKQAQDAFGNWLTGNPNDKRAAYGLASAQIEGGEFAQALTTLQPFTNDAQALALSANALEEIGRTPEAITNLRSAIVADPQHESYYTQFAELCFTYKSYQAGVEVITAGLTKLPQSAKLYLARGILLVQEGNYAGADADFARAETLDPKEASSADAAVLAMVQANHLDEATRALDQKLKQHPRDPQLFLFKAEVLSRQSDSKGSMLAAQKAVTLRPDFVMAHDLLARLYLQNGDEKRAISECQAALKIDPDDETALYRWLRILRARHSESDARSIAELTERWNKAREKQKENDQRESRYRILVSP